MKDYETDGELTLMIFVAAIIIGMIALFTITAYPNSFGIWR